MSGMNQKDPRVIITCVIKLRRVIRNPPKQAYRMQMSSTIQSPDVFDISSIIPHIIMVRQQSLRHDDASRAPSSLRLSVNCETRKTKVSVLGFADYMLLENDRQQTSKLEHTSRFDIS